MLVLFELRLVRLLSAQLAVVLHCLADWLDGGRVLCKLTKTELFLDGCEGRGRGGKTSGRYIDALFLPDGVMAPERESLGRNVSRDESIQTHLLS